MKATEREKRLLRKMNPSRISKIIIELLLVEALFIMIWNLFLLAVPLKIPYEKLDLKQSLEFMKPTVIVLWCVFCVLLLSSKRRKSDLLIELESIYNNNIQPIGKRKWMTEALKHYSYEEKRCELEKKVYKTSLSGCSKKEKIASLRAEIESENIYETLVSFVSVFFTFVLEKDGLNGWLQGFILLVMSVCLLYYLESMKRNRFILTVLDSLAVEQEKYREPRKCKGTGKKD